MRTLVTDLCNEVARIAQGSGDDARAKRPARDRLLPRDRMQQLLDPGTPFLELLRLVAYDIYDNAAPGAGIIIGVGRIPRQKYMIVHNDATVRGGTYYPVTVKKYLRAQEIAEQNHLPYVYLVDSGSVDLPNQDNVFPNRDHFSRIFYNQASLSSKGTPQIAAVIGLYMAGDAYMPAMNDESIIVKGRGMVFLAGPSPVEIAIGEVVSARDLGGVDVHARLSGVTDYSVNNGLHALAQACSIVTYPDRRKPEQVQIHVPVGPRFPAREFYGVILTDTRKPLDVREIITHTVDDPAFGEFKARYGTTLVCGFACIWGYPVGIIANNSILLLEAVLKGAHFIKLCYQCEIPLVLLQNVTGSMMGHKYRNESIAKNGAKMATVVATARVPKFAVTIGGSLGVDDYGMCGRTYSPCFLWMQLNVRISAMDDEQIASILAIVRHDGIEAKGGQWSTNEEAAFKALIHDQYERQGHPYYASVRLWDDGVIDPADACSVLGLGLSANLDAPTGDMNFGILRT